MLRRQAADQAASLVALQAHVEALATRIACLERKWLTCVQREAAWRSAAMASSARLARAQACLADAARAQALVEAQMQRLRAEHAALLASSAWRALAPLRFLAGLLPGWVRRVRRRAPVAPAAPVAPVLRPSDSFRAADPAWVTPSDRPAFAALAAAPPRGRIAVVAHIFYPELWPELADAIDRLGEPFDLFATLVAGAADMLAPAVRARFPFVHVLVVDNHGRDILPFLDILRTGVLARYELICKLHTKRSLWHQDGDAWRQDLIAGVLGSPAIARAVPAAFRADPALGLVVADAHIYAGRELWVGNDRHLSRLFGRFGLDRSAYDRSFAGGSMFWLRGSLLAGLAELDLRCDDFECEPLGADGAMAHAVERMISLLCYRAGATIRPTGAVLAKETLDDLG